MPLTEIEQADAEYNARDCLGMCRVMPHLFAEIQRVGAEGVYAYDELMADLALQMTRIGMPVNTLRREEIGKRLYALREKAIAELTPFTEGEYREPFLDWVASFFAKTVRNGEPSAGTIRLGPTRAAAELEAARANLTAWKVYRKVDVYIEEVLAAGSGDALVGDSGKTKEQNADEMIAACELRVKLAKQALKVAKFTTDEEEGLAHTEETAFAVRCAIRRAEAELAIGKKGVNFGAKVQQAAILRAAGVPLHRTTEKTGLPKIDKEVLEQYGRHQAAKALLAYILTNATINMYIEGDKRAGKGKGSARPIVIGDDGYLHPNWSIHKITGRWGSNPNCFDGTTEVLVRDGTRDYWCALKNLPKGLLVSQYNAATGEYSFAQPRAYIERRNVYGQMVQILSDDIDLLVTVDHRLLVGTAWMTNGDSDYGCRFSDPRDIIAHELLQKAREDKLAGLKFLGIVDGQPAIFPLDKATVRMVQHGVELVYCLSVPTSYLPVRRNGKITIVGQCQNWSKRAGGGAENLRSMIEAPDGYILVGADQKQLEARLIGAMSGCKLMIDCFRRGDDIHGLFAGIGFPNEWPRLAAIFKEHRTAAGGKCHCPDCENRNKMRDRTKNLEYGAFYGGQEQKLFEAIAKDFPEATLGQVREFLARFNAMLPEVLAWRQCTLNEAIKQGEIRSPILGRRQVFPLGRVDPNVAYNYKAQAGGADIWAIGAAKFMEKWNQWEYDARIIHNGHDSVLILCREEVTSQVEQDVYACWNMEWNGVPFEMECKTAKQWSET